MFDKFFERLNLKSKNPSTKSKETNSRLNSKAQNSKNTSSNQNRVVSLSPETTSGSSQFNLRHFSPDPPSRLQNDKGITKEHRIFNPTSTVSKKYGEEKIPNPNNITIDVKKGKPKNLPNFEFRPLDKESIVTNSVNDSVKEGSVLAQNIPPSKAISATRILFAGPQPETVKSAGAKQIFDTKLFKPKKGNPVEEKLQEISMNNYRAKENYETATHSQKTEKRQQAWQEWFTEKKKNNQDLLEAAKFGDIQLAMRLLDKRKGDLRADVNAKGENNWTALHFACLTGNYDFVNLLFFNEASADAETTLKFTPLHVAAQKGHSEIVQLLINTGADINAKDLYNNSPLHYASQNGHKKIVQMLLSRPSLNINGRNNDNKLAYELASTQEIRKIFESFLAEKNLLNSKYTQKIKIHNTKPENVQRMFEAAQPNINKLNSQPTKSSKEMSDNPFYPSKKPTMTSTHFATKETKCETEFFDTMDNEENPSEEKIGPQSFIVHSLLGKGSFGEVYLVEKRDTNVFYAMKVLDKSKVQKHNLQRYVLTERNVLSLTKHPFIVGLNFAFQTADKLFLILDYCPGGDLGEYLQKERRFTEDRARVYLAEIVLALENLHKRDIIFRDLKPDNIVLDSTGHAMLTDFGLSKEGVLDHVNGTKSFCGSVAYLAPEMLKRVGHGKAVDWYLLGVVFYEMLVGMPPYYASNREELFNNIEKAPLKIPANLSPEAKSLIIGLLQRNPPKRLGSGKNDAEEIKAHPFFAKINWSDVEKRKLPVPIPEKRVNFGMRMPSNLFQFGTDESANRNHIQGWSFVAPQHQN